MVHVMKGGGRAPPSSLAWANFTLMTEVRQKAAFATLCTLWVNPCRYLKICTVVQCAVIERLAGYEDSFCTCKPTSKDIGDSRYVFEAD
jgi:hypothetical protein